MQVQVQVQMQEGRARAHIHTYVRTYIHSLHYYYMWIKGRERGNDRGLDLDPHNINSRYHHLLGLILRKCIFLTLLYYYKVHTGRHA